MNVRQRCATWLVVACLPALSGAANIDSAKQTVINDLAPTGRLRAAINFGNGVLVQRGPDGTPCGVSPDLARAIGARLGIPVDLIPFTSAGQTSAAAGSGAWDIAFLAIDPLRAKDMDFTQPYVVIEGVYLVRTNSSFRGKDDVDRMGVTVGVGAGSVYDLFLTRALKKAQLVRNPKGGAEGGIEPFATQGVDVAAGVRNPLEAYASRHPETRVLPDPFQKIEQAIAIPKGRGHAGLAYLRAFLEEAKAQGRIADALKASGQEADVAPPVR